MEYVLVIVLAVAFVSLGVGIACAVLAGLLAAANCLTQWRWRPSSGIAFTDQVTPSSSNVCEVRAR